MGQNKASKVLLVMTIYWINKISSVSSASGIQGGILYPRESESREVKSLDGVWNFRLSPDPYVGFKEKWFTKDLSRVSRRNSCLKLGKILRKFQNVFPEIAKKFKKNFEKDI